MQKIGLVDYGNSKFPNLPLMKISAFHKNRGDIVEWASTIEHYDKVYISKIFGEEYLPFEDFIYNADEVVYGGTGFAIKTINGKEVYSKIDDNPLPYDVEHIYPDYGLYPEATKDTAFGFLSRGCPNNCGFCLVSKKEGKKAVKVADLSEFWHGQRYIKLFDPNILACDDSDNLLQQLIDSKANVDFMQGLDARFITSANAKMISHIKIKCIHFAFDLMKNADAVVNGLKIFKEYNKLPPNKCIVYILTNYNTTTEEDLYRINKVRDLGFNPDVRIYRKEAAPKITRDLQRWCNNRLIYKSCKFEDYVPRKDGKTIKELYF